ncbi:MAG: hypothetical protein V2B14_04750 [bacterium]
MTSVNEVLYIRKLDGYNLQNDEDNSSSNTDANVNNIFILPKEDENQDTQQDDMSSCPFCAMIMKLLSGLFGGQNGDDDSSTDSDPADSSTSNPADSSTSNPAQNSTQNKQQPLYNFNFGNDSGGTTGSVLNYNMGNILG